MQFAKVYKNPTTHKWFVIICALHDLVQEDTGWMACESLGEFALTPAVDVEVRRIECESESEALFVMALHYKAEIEKFQQNMLEKLAVNRHSASVRQLVDSFLRASEKLEAGTLFKEPV
jgi:hypothetical protein